MRHFVITTIVMATFFSTGMSAQSYDNQIADAMNRQDWFALDSIYESAPKDSIHEFLEVYSRCLLGNRLNRPEVSIPAFQELLNTKSTYLDLNNLVASAYMFGMDLNKTGHNEAAATMINAVLEASKQYLDSLSITGLTSTANRYSALTSYTPYKISFQNEGAGKIPFNIVPVGPKEKDAVLMHLSDSYINGIEADITFDTGAGANIISPEMAEKFNLIPLEDTRITVIGVKSRDGYLAIAKELRLGDITVTDVPFTVISLSSNNSEADQYIGGFNIVVGSELMLQLKDLSIDFSNREITIPSTPPDRSDTAPNLCFSPTMNLLTKGTLLSTPIMMCIDSGDASFGTAANYFFERNKEYITSHAELDTIREAGIAGTIHARCYKVPGISVSLGGTTVIPSEFTVKIDETSMRADYECIIGVKTLMLYDKVRFNLVDFVLTTEPAAIPAHTPCKARQP